MSFKFNFDGGCTNDNEKELNVESNETENLRPCLSHKISLENVEISDLMMSTLQVGCHTMYFVNPDCAASKIDNAKITSLITSSDLESGEYEGGLKVWECTYDLLNYLNEQKDACTTQKRVLDLGCGAGLLGLYAYLNDASYVCLQDYNSEVIDSFTIPTVCATFQQNEVKHRECKIDFYSGDWGAVGRYLKDQHYEKFDLILSSETIYNVDYYAKICDFLREHLSRDGRALFAAKTHYFGVGGGTFDFVKFISSTKLFDISVVFKTKQGLSREILMVVWSTDKEDE